MSYRVIRMYQSGRDTETIETGLTLEEAQAHCQDPETSSSTATSAEAAARTEEYGPWFDGYEDDDREPPTNFALDIGLAIADARALLDSITDPGADTIADGEHRKAAL